MHRKKTLFITSLLFFFTILYSYAQHTQYTVSIKNGTVNKLTPKTSMNIIKKQLPSFTGWTKEKAITNFAGGVFYKNDDIYFYTYLDIINIRDGFTGKIDIPVFSKTISQIEEAFGNDYRIVGTKDFDDLYEFKQAFGYLYFYFEDDLCTEIYMTIDPIEKCEERYQKIMKKEMN